MEYRQNTAGYDDIATHFAACDSDFIRDLSSRVDLKDYINKILVNAIRYEAWSSNRLVGLLAVYTNPEFDFITNVSVVKDFAGQGTASALLKQCIDHSKNEIKLEVASHNKAAQALYKKFCFSVRDNTESSFIMTLSAHRVFSGSGKPAGN